MRTSSQTPLFSFGMLVILAMLPAVLAHGREPDTDDKAAVLQIEERWATALIKSDVRALGTIYADDLVYVHSGGNRETKAEYIGRIETGRLKYESVNLIDPRVRVYGDAAVVNGSFDVKAVSDGAAANHTVVYIHVYARRGSTWQMVAHQTTRAPAP